MDLWRSASPRTEDVDPDDVDALLAAELNNMTFDERENMYEEIHGVEKEFEETDEFLDQHLLKLEQALKTVPNRSLYERAWRESRQYVEDRAFRLKFLRAEYYDEKKAAARLVKFLEGKIRFFGDDSLARPVTLADFTPEDMAFLKTGILQLIPARDRKGRAIITDFNMNPNFKLPNIHSLVSSVLVESNCARREFDLPNFLS